MLFIFKINTTRNEEHTQDTFENYQQEDIRKTIINCSWKKHFSSYLLLAQLKHHLYHQDVHSHLKHLREIHSLNDFVKKIWSLMWIFVETSKYFFLSKQSFDHKRMPSQLKFLTLFFIFLLIQTLSILYILLNSNIINCLGLHTKITHFIFLCFETL